MAETVEWRNYRYNPSRWAAILFTVLFFVLILVQTIQALISIRFIKKNGLNNNTKISWGLQKYNFFKRRKSYENLEDVQKPDGDIEACEEAQDSNAYNAHTYVWILLPFYLGLFCEFIGFGGRIFSHNKIDSTGPYLVQALLLILGPPLFSATIYMAFGRIVTTVLHNENYLLIYPKYITTICVVGDLLSLNIQGAGGSLMSNADENIKYYSMGEYVVIAGLAIQILFFGFFVIIEATYYFRLQRNIHASQYNSKIINEDIRYYPKRFINWKTILVSLFVCSIFILIRSIYRVVEFVQGNSGYVASHEWFLYFFDAVMMFLSGLLFVSQDVSNYFLKTVPLTKRLQELK